jgi:hypothetical protein
VEDAFPGWFAALEERHLAERSFAEVRRGVQALSSLYVERRERLGSGAALDGAGKRAAFALFYGPLHFLTLREIVRALGATRLTRPLLLDLGCGTFSAGAGWASCLARPAELWGVEKNAWAAGEARFNLSRLRLRGRVVRADLERYALPAGCGAILLAWSVNELGESGRGRLLPELLAAARSGADILVVEPLARLALRFWDDWAAAFCGAGGRADEWRFDAVLPARLALLGRGAGLDHRQLTARSLWLPGGSERALPQRQERGT